jgi:hypothetical protein
VIPGQVCSCLDCESWRKNHPDAPPLALQRVSVGPDTTTDLAPSVFAPDAPQASVPVLASGSPVAAREPQTADQRTGHLLNSLQAVLRILRRQHGFMAPEDQLALRVAERVARGGEP